MNNPVHKRLRSFFAILCMLAVVLLYARPAAAAWSAYSSACCASGQCNIAAHHHQKQQSAAADHMDCGHHMSGMISCSMSCCQDSDHAAVASAIFVMPHVLDAPAPATHTTAISLEHPVDLLRAIEPVAPPPRFSSSAF